ncbi:hypothetical protein [Bacillus atrophaeus]|uniref:hypothetical protein n=1 Tax=Bacillus atrophaeus TaxID=1452 RepID=UPI000779C558|nr:hypothetical protein [Bacillus atrophaeus]
MMIKHCENDFKIQLGKPVRHWSSGVQEEIGLFLTLSTSQIEFRFLNNNKFGGALRRVEHFIGKQFKGETVGIIHHNNVARLKEIPKVKIINLN